MTLLSQASRTRDHAEIACRMKAGRPNQIAGRFKGALDRKLGWKLDRISRVPEDYFVCSRVVVIG